MHSRHTCAADLLQQPVETGPHPGVAPRPDRHGPEQNWLAPSDIRNLLRLTGFELVGESQARPAADLHSAGERVREPVARAAAGLPRWFTWPTSPSLASRRRTSATPLSVSVVVPARNERGNIEPLVERVPRDGTGRRDHLRRGPLERRHVGGDPGRRRALSRSPHPHLPAAGRGQRRRRAAGFRRSASATC